MGGSKKGQRHGGMFQEFFHSEASGAIFLLAAAVIALVWANVPGWSDLYFDLERTYISLNWGDQPLINMSLGHWIGDGLFVIFFFVVGLEVKREIVVGELSSLRKAFLPVSAALGGMLIPALLYASLNIRGAAASGWGIPMATDIAFALGILSLFGERVPLGLKVFLTALAIADDIGAVLVIALFYTSQIDSFGLGLAAVFLALIVAASRFGIRQIWIYLLLMVGVWFGIYSSGIHATVAGVLIAMLVPVKARIEPREFIDRSRGRLHELEQAGLTRESMIDDHAQVEALDDMYFAVEDMRPAGLTLEHRLHRVQSFLILPLFALFKAGVRFDTEMLAAFPSTISLGIMLGLVLGKPFGVMLFSWLAIRSGRADMPAGVNWSQLAGAGCLAGVGFTMSIFISELAFAAPKESAELAAGTTALLGQAKIGVLFASLLAGTAGYVLLNKALPPASTPIRENQS